MSELKGQLLGIIMVLVIFGTVSVAVAQIFKTSKEKITTEATNITKDAEDTLNGRALLTYNND